MKLNIGCGRVPLEGFVNADLNPGSDAIVFADLDGRLPWEDATFDFVQAHHVLEHVLDRNHAFQELARVTKPGGFLEIRTPYGLKSLYNPAHRWAFTEATYEVWCEHLGDDCCEFPVTPPFEPVIIRHQRAPPFIWHIRKYVPWAEKYLNPHGARRNELYAMLRRRGQ